MILAVLILSSLLPDLQANYVNKNDQTVHKIHKRGILRDGMKLCEGKSVKQCEKERPEELKQCKICGLINPVELSRLNTFKPNTDKNMIIGGELVKPPYKFPWMVAIMKNQKEKICGGAIISDRYILTAGHCVTQFGSGDQFERYYSPDELTIGFLTSTYDVDTGNKIEKIIRHPQFQPDKMKYDFALIKLSQKITCGTFKNPICLPFRFSADRTKDTTFEITGWGSTSGTSANYPKTLLHGTVKMVSYSTCERNSPLQLENIAYCLLGIENQRPCYGDSGGSLFFRDSLKYVSIGIASLHTSQQCSKSKPFIYASIPKVLSWIKRVIRDKGGQQENLQACQQECRPKCQEKSRPKCQVKSRPKCQERSRPKCQVKSRPKCQERSRPKCQVKSRPKCQERSRPKCQEKSQEESFSKPRKQCK